MKTIRIHGKEEIKLEEVETPTPAGDEVLVRMQYSGICGSDLHYYFHGANGAFVVTEPLTPGHEVSGVVEQDPSGRWPKGTRVTIAPATYGTAERGIEDKPYLWPGGSYLGSASTNPHTQGGMSEFRVVKDFMVRELPEGLSTRDAALAEPLAVALHALRIAGDVTDQRVLVCGSGPIGLLVAAACVVKGAAEVTSTDVLAGPLKRATQVGVHHTLTVGIDEIPSMAYDIVFECSGVPVSITPALDACRRGGTVTQVGMLPNEKVPVNLASFVSKEVSYKGCFRFDDEIDEAVTMLAEHPEIARVITHEIPADKVVEAFETARNSQESGKVLVSLWLD